MTKEVSRPNFMAPIWAALRQGGHEIAPAFQALPTSNIRVVEEPGTLGNPTPQMVTEESGALREKESIFDRYDSRESKSSDRGWQSLGSPGDPDLGR